MSPKTLRPLKKGDPCWVRIQRRGKPVLAVYDRMADGVKADWVVVDGRRVACYFYKVLGYDSYEAIFVAKPIPENWRELI